MRSIFLSLLLFNLSLAAYMQEDIWWKGESLLSFFEKHNISKKIYFDLSKTDKELCSEITAGVEYQTLYEDNTTKLLQVLIPISEEMQIHLFRDKKDNFVLDIIPIVYDEEIKTIAIKIENSPYRDIVKHTGNRKLANSFMLAFKKTVNFKRLRKSDIIAIKYKQKIRLGKYFGQPDILGALVTVRGVKHYIFKNPDDDRFYDQNGRSLTNVYFKIPLNYRRISSKFTYKRWHPILKRYRAHLGVDFAAPTGRKVYATGDGKIIHKGRKGGYGKTIMIRHKNGYRSLYAHLSGYNNRIHVGSYVKQGTYIGRVGSTGRSTGPHLHFGIYKRGRAVDPLKVVNSSKTRLTGKKRKKFLKIAREIKYELDEAISNPIKKVVKGNSIEKVCKGGIKI